MVSSGNYCFTALFAIAITYFALKHNCRSFGQIQALADALRFLSVILLFGPKYRCAAVNILQLCFPYSSHSLTVTKYRELKI